MNDFVTKMNVNVISFISVIVKIYRIKADSTLIPVCLPIKIDMKIFKVPPFIQLLELACLPAKVIFILNVVSI